MASRQSPPPIPSGLRKKSRSSHRSVRQQKKRRSFQFFPIVLFIPVLTLFFLLIRGCFSTAQSEPEIYEAPDPWAISDAVYSYEGLLDQALAEYGLQDYKEIMLCIMQVESAGLGEDVMQSSESLDLPLNSLNPEQSISQGVAFFASLLEKSSLLGTDLDSAVQAYNYGSGFLDYVAANGGQYSFELAEEFSREHSGNVKVDYPNPLAIEKNGGYRWNYGNMFYVSLVDHYQQRLHEIQNEQQTEQSVNESESDQ